MATNDNNESRLLKVLAFVLVLSLGLNVILVIKRTEIFPTKKELQVENIELSQKVTEFSNELNKYKGISQQLDRVIKDAEQKIAEKENEIQTLLRNRGRTQQEKEKLLAQIDSLHEQNLHLVDSLLIERQEQQVLNSKIEDLETVIEGLNKKIGVAENLIADDIQITPQKRNLFGNIAASALAKKVHKIDICFNILENRIAKSGAKNLYVVVTSPDAEVIVDGGGEAPTFAHPDHNKQARYTTTESVQYNNDKLNVCADVEITTPLKEGLYVVELFSQENKLGTTTFTLR